MPQLTEQEGTDFSRSLSTVMLGLLAPVWLLFMFISWFRYRYAMNKALEAVRNMEPGQNLREVRVRAAVLHGAACMCTTRFSAVKDIMTSVVWQYRHMGIATAHQIISVLLLI